MLYYWFLVNAACVECVLLIAFRFCVGWVGSGLGRVVAVAIVVCKFGWSWLFWWCGFGLLVFGDGCG